MSETPDTQELAAIQAAIAGQDGAFDGLVGRYAARLRWLIQLRLDPSVLARVSVDDVLQEVLIIVSGQIRNLEVQHEAAFWTWLCRVVEQRLIDVRRRHLQAAVRDVRRERRLDGPRPSASFRLADLLCDPGTSPSGQLRSVEQREALAAALGQLPPSYREVIVLRILEGLSVSETAEIMGRSANAVSVVLTKAIKRLGLLIASSDPASGAGPEQRP